MNRAELQTLTAMRLLDAQALLAAGRWEFAYYAAGYAVECALKSCVLSRMVETGLVFKEKWDAKQCLTHDVNDLIRLAGLVDLQNDELKANPAFAANCRIVEAWIVSTRYAVKTEADARGLFVAITDRPNGVLEWIQKYW